MSLMKHLIHNSLRLKSLPSPEWSNILQVLSWRAAHTPFRLAFYELNELGDITRSITYFELYQNALKHYQNNIWVECTKTVSEFWYMF